MKNKKAFTLAEMMIVLLVISLAAAAFLPIMTKRSKSSSSSAGGNANNIWQYVSDTDKDIYAITDAALGAIIGADSFAAGDNSRLLINTSGLSQSDILMKQGGNQTGSMSVDSTGSVKLINSVNGGALNNVIIGNLAGKNITSGYDNIAMGRNALKSGTNGWNNVAIGENALGNFNYNGGGNTAIGVDALGANSAANNTSVGSESCTSASGSYNTCLGTLANVQSGLDHATAIGADATATKSYTVVLGTVNDTVIIPGRLKLGMVSEVNRGGNYLSDVQLTQTTLGDYYTLNAHGASNTAYNGCPTTVISDRRLKNVKGLSTTGLEQVRQLKTYNYTLKKDKEKTPQVGVMAQDLQKVFPHAVTKGDDGYLRIRQEDIFYAMVNSIKQLDVITQGLVKDFKSLVARIQTIDDRIIALIKVDQINGKKIKELELKNKLLEQQNSTIQKQNKAFELRLKKLEKRIK